LYPVLIALLQWGDRHLAGETGPPVEVQHTACGQRAAAAVVCTGCGQTLTARDTRGIHSRAAPDRHARAPRSPASEPGS